MALLPDRSITQRGSVRFKGGALSSELTDHVAVEEPLEIRVAGDTVAVTMRTPGDDHRLALGFLYAEGIIQGAQDLTTVAHCGHPGEEGYGNVIDCAPAAGAKLEVEKVRTSRRGTLTTAACGVCGRRTISDLLALCEPLPPSTVSLEVLSRATERLTDMQRIFERTGGTHAAVALDEGGMMVAGFEDVGRHNAVDKVVGELVLRGLRPQAPSPAAVLAVSGRASFEIIQKAARARIPVVAAVSAASSLAIDLAEKMNVTLASFVRGGSLNVFSRRERIR